MKMTLSSLTRAGVALAAVLPLAFAACGGPAGPSGAEGVTVRGTVVPGSASASFASAAAAGTVTVEREGDPATRTTVGAQGVFTLRGLPEGSFTLVFRIDGVEVGRATFEEVAPNQEIVLTVAVTSAGVHVLEEKRNGIGHGDLEIEGRVDRVVSATTSGDSRFVIDGRTVVARPGQTAIREGGTARTVLDVTAGRQVHVKGVWLAGGGAQEVLAHEIKLQGASSGTTDPGETRACLINGGRAGEGIELEGHVESGSAGGFRMRVNGNRASGLVDIDTGGAAFDCKGGSSAPTTAECRARVTSGAKVHVSGTLSSCSVSAARVAARTIKVQK